MFGSRRRDIEERAGFAGAPPSAGGFGGPFEAPHVDQTKRDMICPPRIFM
jgi:hypothetical protein